MKIRSVILDFVLRAFTPWVGFVTLISGALVTYDFTSMRAKYPDWPGLFDILESGVLVFIFLGFALISALLSWAMTKRQKTLRGMQDEIDQCREQMGEIGNNIKFLFDGLLLNLSKKLNFKQDDQARISIYIHNEADGKFIPCGRYSPNPELRKPGRTSFPDTQGCIANGWQRGWHYDNSFPETKTRHQNHCASNYNIPKETHDKFKMLSHVYAVMRFDDNAGTPLAVIVVESMKNDQFDANQLQADLESVADDFAQMIATLRPHIPTPCDASVRGL